MGFSRGDIARLRRNQIDVTAKISKSTKMRRPGDRHPFKLFFVLFEIFAVKKSSRKRSIFAVCSAKAQRKKNVRRARKLLEFGLPGRGGIPETKTPRLGVSAGINVILQGRYGYFRHASREALGEVDGWKRGRRRSILRKRRGGKGRGRGLDHQRWGNRYFAELGLFCIEETQRSEIAGLRPGAKC